MIDVNNKEHLKKLSKAINSDEGQLIVEYIKQELAELDYRKIDVTEVNEIVGERFKVIHKIKEFFNELLIFKQPS